MVGILVWTCEWSNDLPTRSAAATATIFPYKTTMCLALNPLIGAVARTCCYIDVIESIKETVYPRFFFLDLVVCKDSFWCVFYYCILLYTTFCDILSRWSDTIQTEEEWASSRRKESSRVALFWSRTLGQPIRGNTSAGPIMQSRPQWTFTFLMVSLILSAIHM
jgi:hypothetical protein